MSDNMWQRSVSKTLLRIVQEIGATSPLAFLNINLTPIIDAAEDAEREGRTHDEIGNQLRPGPVPSPTSEGASTPVQGLPPLDPALVEECARAWATARGSIQDGIAAALTHYRERVEGPLRAELRQSGYDVEHYRFMRDTEYNSAVAMERERDDARAEADRLRGELNQYDERGHEAKLELDRLRGELAAARAGGFIK